MILGYKKWFPWKQLTNFAYKIIHGIKKHSIRIDENNRWKPGMKIQHAHGVRTKDYMQFFENICKSTQKIEIIEVELVSKNSFTYVEEIRGAIYMKTFMVKVDGKILTLPKIALLASNDGFDSTHDFFRWFIDGFKGKIIHWTDLKY